MSSHNITIMAPHSLPTPANSTEIVGKSAEPGTRFGSIDKPFSLPPAALTENTPESNATASPSPAATSDSSYRPISPSIPNAASRPNKVPATTRRRSSTHSKQQVDFKAAQRANGYIVPPPPTRSRKIIQMKPQAQKDVPEKEVSIGSKTANTSLSTLPNGTKASPAQVAGAKRKQGAAGTTAAVRKTARKTAHSLIERRRRSKMNEEFGVLKDMIPACNGQEMHKLAILQASIEYMRYLEQCLTDLKAAHSNCDPAAASTSPLPPALNFRRQSTARDGGQDAQAEKLEEASDEDMSDAASPRTLKSSRYYHAPTSSIHSHQPSISPAILPSSFTSPAMSSAHRESYTSYHSAYSSQLPSPAFEAQMQGSSGPSYSTFRLTSPALRPQEGRGEVQDMEKDDHEATAALLMLNTDRRKWSGPSRGMSVMELLG